jgi:hypothetical protein
MGAIFVFSAGLLFEDMKRYRNLRRIAGLIAIFGFAVLCIDMISRARERIAKKQESVEHRPASVLSSDLLRKALKEAGAENP